MDGQTITVVYGLNSNDQRQELWAEIRGISNTNAHPWIIEGDFNVVRFVDDGSGGDRHDYERQVFNDLPSELDPH